MLKSNLMKVLMFCRFYEPHIGGVEKHVQKISEILIEKGFKIALITEKFKDDLPDREEIEGVTVYRIKLLKYLWLNKFLIWAWLFKRLNLIKNADIIHCHDIFFWYLPFRLLFPKKPVYLTFHGWEGKFPVPKRFIFARKVWEKLAWGNICVGEYLKKWYGANPNYLIYGGVEIKTAKFRSRIFGNSNLISFIGRISEDTGIFTYLKVFEFLRKGKTELKIEFYGNGPLIDVVKKKGKTFGFIKEIDNKIKKSKLVFTSSFLSILESLINKKLTISVYENILKMDYLYLTPFKDFIIIDKDPKNLSDKILYYLSHPEEEKKLVEKGYEWAKTQTWEKVADLYLKLWEIKQ